MSYQQLTEGKRYPIAVLVAQGLRPSEVARIINVHRSTVYRELRRNRQERQYDPVQAHALIQRRRRCSARYRVPQDTIDFVELALSWDRGLNENFNGLLRQYIQKGVDMRMISDEFVLRVERRLNLRPRKCLGFKQPEAVFRELVQAA